MKSRLRYIWLLFLCFLFLCLSACVGNAHMNSDVALSPASSSGETPESGPEQTKPSESSRAEEPSASEAQESSETGESAPSSYPVVDWEDFPKPEFSQKFEFPQDDPSQDMSYEEYFSTERYLENYELQYLQYLRGTPYGSVDDMWGYRYVKGEPTGREKMMDDSGDSPSWRWGIPEDNLYLLCEETGERVLLAEIKNLRYIRIFIDRLYLITETEVWRCGRLGENLTCVYENPSRIYIQTPYTRSADVLYFTSTGSPWNEDHAYAAQRGFIDENYETNLWRLYVPSGRADKVCVMEDLPENFDTGSTNYFPVSNYAILTYGGNPQECNVYSTRTGRLTPFEYDGVNAYWDA